MTRPSFHQLTEIESTDPTLIEGLPGTGMVASIAVDTVTEQLGLEHHGTIRAESFPAVASFEDGLVRDPVRVYAGGEPAVMTLRSDVPVPEEAHSALARCVLDELADEFGRAIFLAGAPARSEEQRGDVAAVATTDGLRADLEVAGLDIAEDAGAVGGVTGALVQACYQGDAPAALLLVRTDPRLPDPQAARSAIEGALEPLVAFDIDTDQLREQAEEVQEQKQALAQQLGGGAGEEAEPMQSLAMFQ